jgi:7-cyano-7-deazaguanine reductase
MAMAAIHELHEQYARLEARYKQPSEGTIDSNCLLAFDYEYPEQDAEVVIDTDEFTAVCPWTGLPDCGTLSVRYVPDRLCIELKSLKYYLLSYRSVGIVQEHAANRILRDLVSACRPRRMTVTLDYKVRGGLHTTVTTRYDHTGHSGALSPNGAEPGK